MTETEKLEQIIHTFCNCQSSEQALLIKGGWGCGKTYFINELIKNNRNYIYFSLNGVDNVSVLIKSLLALILSGKSEKIKESNILSKVIQGGIEAASKFNDKVIFSITDTVLDLSIDSFSNKIFAQKNGNLPILVLDDLERISEKIDITDLLGAIHSRFMVNGVKVIYIADETKIKLNNEDDRKSYDSEKEKYIYRTIDFRRDNSKVYKALLKNRKIDESFVDILSAVFPNDQDNLRSVQSCLDLYNEIINAFKKIKTKDKYNTPENLFYSICAIGKFYKNGNSDKEKLREALAGYLYYNQNDNNIDEYQKFVKDVRSKNFYYCFLDNFLLDFIYDGYLDAGELKNFLRKPEEDGINTLVNIDNLETKELKDLLIEVKQNLEDKKYTIRQYGVLLQNFVDNAVILQLCKKEEALKLIEDSIFSDLADNKAVLVQQYEHWLKDSYSLIKNPKNPIEERLLKEFNIFATNYTKDITKNFYEKLVKVDSSIFIFDGTNKDLFTRLVNEKYNEKIINLPNKSLNMFTTYISSAVCNLMNANDFFKSETDALESIKKSVSEKLKSLDESDFLKKNALEKLDKILQQAIEHIGEK